MPELTHAARDVLAERERQKAVEGWTEAHDDEHNDGSLAVVAACYVLPEQERGSRGRPVMWPDSWHFSWWKPSPNHRRRELVKAGALILAEIERLDRAALSTG